MDGPDFGSGVVLKLRRISECGRLQEQVLREAYECLVSFVMPQDASPKTPVSPPPNHRQDRVVPEKTACGVGSD